MTYNMNGLRPDRFIQDEPVFNSTATTFYLNLHAGTPYVRADPTITISADTDRQLAGRFRSYLDAVGKPRIKPKTCCCGEIDNRYWEHAEECCTFTG